MYGSSISLASSSRERLEGDIIQVTLITHHKRRHQYPINTPYVLLPEFWLYRSVYGTRVAPPPQSDPRKD